MYVPEDLKVNKAVDVHLPDNMTYFGRFGQASVGSQYYTGDDPALMDQRKVDDLATFQRYAELKAEEERSKAESND